MTINDLKNCKRLRNDVESLQERIDRLRSQAERYTRPLSLAPGGDAVDYLPEYAAKLDELQRELQRREVTYQEHIDGVETWLRMLPEQQATVMRLRYVQGLRWREVAKRAEYTIEHCRKINMVAIRKVDTQ